jgi:hypothetical protein
MTPHHQSPDNQTPPVFDFAWKVEMCLNLKAIHLPSSALRNTSPHPIYTILEFAEDQSLRIPNAVGECQQSQDLESHLFLG